MIDNTLTSKESNIFSGKIKAIYPHITVGGDIDKPYYSIDWYDIEKQTMYRGYSSYKLPLVRKWLQENFEVVEADIDDLINRQKAEIERLSKCVMSEEQVENIIRQIIDRDFRKRMLEDYQKLVDSFFLKVYALNCGENSKRIIMNTLRLALQDVQGQDVKSLKTETVKGFAKFLIDKSVDGVVDIINLSEYIKEWTGESNE